MNIFNKYPFLIAEIGVNFYDIAQKEGISDMEAAKLMIDEAKKDPNIVKIIIFGSATRASCHLWSDIDVYFEMKENKEMPAIASSEEAYDKWNNFTVDESLYREIMNEGVVVYEK